MKLFRMRRKPENGEAEQELVLDTDAQEEASAQEMTEAEAETVASAAAATPEPAAGPAAQAEAIPPPDDPLAQIRAEAPGEIAAGEEPPEGDPASPQPDDSLDPDLLDLFREAKNEVQEGTLASELPDIPIQDLLSDLVSVSQGLGITRRARAEPNQGKTGDHGRKPDQGGK